LVLVVAVRLASFEVFATGLLAGLAAFRLPATRATGLA